MLITITPSVSNEVYKAVVATESTSLEVEYMKAYGEPRVQSGGTLSFPDPVRTVQTTTGDALVKGVVADTVNSRTLVYLDTTKINLGTVEVGDSVAISGVEGIPTLNATFLVQAIDSINGAIAIALTGVATSNPFKRNVTEGYVTTGAQVANQAIAGFTDDATDLVVQIKPGSGLNFGALTPGDDVAIAGVTLAPGLNGTRELVSSDGTALTLTFATAGLTSIPVFQVDAPAGDAVATPANVPFTVNTQEQYVRSSSPVSFSIDGKVDAAAKIKTLTWARDLKDKIVAAMTTLKAQPNPATHSVVETAEI